MGIEYLARLVSTLEKENIDNRIVKEVKLYSTENTDDLLKRTGYSDEEVERFILTSEKFKGLHEGTDNNGRSATNEEAEQALAGAKSLIISTGVSREKEALFILGLPGAGKSSALSIISEMYKHRFFLIDADEYKKGIFDSEGKELVAPLADPKLNGIDVETIHKASSELAKLVLELVSNGGYNVALPKIGEDYRRLDSNMVSLKKKGYKIYVHFVFTTVETSLKRNLIRFKAAIKTGDNIRLVPPNLICEAGYIPLDNFFAIINDGKCDDYCLWDGEYSKQYCPVKIWGKQ